MVQDFFKGLFTGLVFPVAAFYFYVTLMLHTDIKPGFYQLRNDNLLTQVIALSVLANILPLFVFNKKNEEQKLKGVVGASILYAFVISLMYFI